MSHEKSSDKQHVRKEHSSSGGMNSSWSRNMNTNEMIISSSSKGALSNVNSHGLRANMNQYFPQEFDNKFSRESIRDQLKSYAQVTKKGISSEKSTKNEHKVKPTSPHKEASLHKDKKKHKKSDSIDIERRIFPGSSTKYRETNYSQKHSPRVVSEINANASFHESYLNTPNERVYTLPNQHIMGQSAMNGSFIKSGAKCNCNHCNGVCSCGYRSDSTQIIDTHFQSNYEINYREKLEKQRGKKKHYKNLYVQEKNRVGVLERKLEEQINFSLHTEGRLREALEIHREDEVVNADVVELREELRKMDDLVKLYENKRQDVAGAEVVRCLQQQLELKKKCNMKLAKKLEKLKRELAKYMGIEQDLVGKNLWLENELKGSEKALKVYEGKVQTSELEIHKLNENAAALSKQLLTLQTHFRESQVEIENLKKLLRESENREDEQSLKKKLKVIQEKKRALKDELNEALEEKRKSIEQLKSEINELRNTVNALRTEKTSFLRTVEQLELEKKRLNDDRNKLISEATEIKLKVDDVNHLKMKLKKKEQEVEELAKRKVHAPPPQILEKVIEVPVEKIVPVNVEKVVPIQKIVEIERPVLIETIEPIHIRETQHFNYNRVHEAFEMQISRLNADLEYVTNISNEKAKESEIWRGRLINAQDNFESELKIIESRYRNESEQSRGEIEVYRQEITFLKSKLEAVQRELSILTQGRMVSAVMPTTSATAPIMELVAQPMGATTFQNIPMRSFNNFNNTMIGSYF